MPTGYLPEVTVMRMKSVTMTGSNTTGDGGSLFELDEQFAPGEGGIQLYAKIRDGFEDDLRRLFEIVAASGFGKKKSSGKGNFRVERFEPFDRFDAVTGATGFITLSHFCPRNR